jgi:hypothetical protein
MDVISLRSAYFVNHSLGVGEGKYHMLQSCTYRAAILYVIQSSISLQRDSDSLSLFHLCANIDIRRCNTRGPIQ